MIGLTSAALAAWIPSAQAATAINLKAAGLRCPEDVAVTGWDDIAIATVIDPPLTTIRVDREELVRVALELLAQRIDGEDSEGRHVQVGHRLVIRGSAPA